ncbi:MAG: hypothetical protein ACRDD1_17375, partial [Planctomycetia bacterium]
ARKLEAELPASLLPSWSSDGKRLAYFSTAEPPGIYLSKVGRWAESRRALDVDDAFQPVVWDRPGHSFLGARIPGDGPRRRLSFPMPPDKVLLVQVPVEPIIGEPRIVQRLNLTGGTEARLSAFYFTINEPTQELVVGILPRTQRSHFRWMSLEGDSPRRVWHPIDDGVAENQIPLGVPQLAPVGRYLALRYGLPEWSAPLGVYDLQRNRLATWAPNDAVRMRALWSIVEAVRRIVRKAPPESPSPFRLADKSSADERRRTAQTTSLPLELFDRPEVQAARDEVVQGEIEQLAGHGLELLFTAEPGLRPEAPTVDAGAPSREGRAAARSANLRRQFHEIALFLQYARGDYAAALAVLDRLEAPGDAVPSTESGTSPDEAPLVESMSRDHRLALGAVRAQCLLASGKPLAARRMLPQLIHERSANLKNHGSGDDLFELRMLGTNPPRSNGANLGADPLLERLEMLLDSAYRRP